MNVSPDSPASIMRPSCSGSNKMTRSNAAHVRRSSWYLQGRALFSVFLVAFVAPTSISAAPPTLRPHVHVDVHPRQASGPQGNGGGGQQGNGGGGSNGTISMNVWLPILLVTIVFVLFSFITCVRRCAVADAAATARMAANAANRASENTTRPRRRPRRTPSQISTKSLPPYMKEPGDHELVLFRGPAEADDTVPPQPMPMLAEDDEEHPEMRGATFDVPLDRVETMDTMGDSSTTNLIRRASASVQRPPELHHPAMPHDRRRTGDGDSMDSVGSEAELLPLHRRTVSTGADPRGEAPSYAEAVSAEAGMTSISLDDSANDVIPPFLLPSRGRSRFSFLTQNPFSSHNHTNSVSSTVDQSPAPVLIRSESPVQHVRQGSALSRFSTRESHENHHSRTPSRTLSNPNLFRVFRSHSPGLHAGSSTISLDSISAPLTHTATRAEIRAPKGGLLTPEQIKLITSIEGLERFGVPYGPDAVAAFSLSRERLVGMGPPPDFESVASGSEVPTSRSEVLEGDTASSHRAGESRVSTAMSYATAPEPDGQIVQTYASRSEGEGETDGDDEPRTARPTTPRTARPSGHSGDH